MHEQAIKRRAAAELAARGAAVFEPVGGSPGVDLAVRAGDGQYVEVIVKEPASPDQQEGVSPPWCLSGPRRYDADEQRTL